jgi:hypothetical protein
VYIKALVRGDVPLVEILGYANGLRRSRKSLAFYAPPALINYSWTLYRSFIRELCRWKFVRIPRGRDKGAFYIKVSRCGL